MYLSIETDDNVFVLKDDEINTINSLDSYYLYRIIELISGRYQASDCHIFSNPYSFVRLSTDNYLIDLGFNTTIGKCIYKLEINYKSMDMKIPFILDIPFPEDTDPNNVDFGCLYISLIYPYSLENFRYLLNGERIDLTLEDDYFQVTKQNPTLANISFTEFINTSLKGNYTDKRTLVSNKEVLINGQYFKLSTFTDGYKEAVYYLFWCFTLILNNPGKERILLLDLFPYKISDFVDEKLKMTLIAITRGLRIRLVTNNNYTITYRDQINRNK